MYMYLGKTTGSEISDPHKNQKYVADHPLTMQCGYNKIDSFEKKNIIFLEGPILKLCTLIVIILNYQSTQKQTLGRETSQEETLQAGFLSNCSDVSDNNTFQTFIPLGTILNLSPDDDYLDLLSDTKNQNVLRENSMIIYAEFGLNLCLQFPRIFFFYSVPHMVLSLFFFSVVAAILHVQVSFHLSGFRYKYCFKHFHKASLFCNMMGATNT